MVDVIPTLAFGFIGDIEITITGLSEKQLFFEYHGQLDAYCYKVCMILFHPNSYLYKNFEAEITITEVVKRTFGNFYTASLVVDNLTDYIEIFGTYQTVEKQRNVNHELQKLKSFSGIFTKTYPFEKDKERYDDYKAQISKWFPKGRCTSSFCKSFTKIIQERELAFVVSQHNDYKKLLDDGVQNLINEKISSCNLQDNPISDSNFTRIYLGNEFCPNLFPDMGTMECMIDKLLSENYSITICYPYLQESRLSQLYSLLDLMHSKTEKSKRFEITVNDWGMLNFLQRSDLNIECILGRLLNKRKKDSRHPYWKGYHHDDTVNKVNNFNNEILRKYLYSMGITRFEFEDYEQTMDIPTGNHSLHYPYYQVNTSTFCNLYADINGKSQDNVVSCGHDCQNIYYEYPKHLKLIGKGNSIFGYNPHSVLYDLDKLEYYTNNHIDRFVLTL